jgi:hypothetical protein
MSEGEDPHAFPPVPVSAGPPPLLRILFLIALAIVFMQGSFVVGSSAFGRIWPAANSEKIPLPPAPPESSGH